jgi:hypothetical protein
MFIINASVPDHAANIHVPTRIVVGCGEQAIAVNALLQQCGIEGEVKEVDVAPMRSSEEMLRAQRLMALLFVPAYGNA